MSKERVTPECLGTPENPQSSCRAGNGWIKIGDFIKDLLSAEDIKAILFEETEGLDDTIPVGEDGLALESRNGNPVLSELRSAVRNHVMRVRVDSVEGPLVPFDDCRPLASGICGANKLSHIPSNPRRWGTVNCHREVVDGRVVVYYRVFTVDEDGIVIGIKDGLRGTAIGDYYYVDVQRTMMANMPKPAERCWGWEKKKSGCDKWL